MRAPRIQGASCRRGVPFPEGRRTGTGPSAGRVRRRPAPGDNGPPARDLDAQGDLRWKDVVAGLLVQTAGLIGCWNAQNQASVVLCGPQVAVPFDFQSEAFTPVLGDDGDPLDHAAASFEGLRCLVRSQRHEGLGVLTVWHDERASYQAVLGPRPYKRRPVQVIRIGQRLWQGFVPAMFDLFGEQVPDHVCLHLVRRWDNPQPGLAFVPLGRNSEDILDACDETHGPSIPRVIDIDKERLPTSSVRSYSITGSVHVGSLK